jgi:hypothetical protein
VLSPASIRVHRETAGGHFNVAGVQFPHLVRVYSGFI